MRYPRIDSANYVVDSRYYRTALKDMFALLSEDSANMKLFYSPTAILSAVLIAKPSR